jgi:putative transcriptional regulator
MKQPRIEKSLPPSLGIQLCGALLLIVALVQPAHRLAAQQESELAGQLLVATAEMKDPRFVESVIYIVQHNHEGTLGLVINRPLAQAPIEDMIKGSGVDGKAATRKITVHYGGPVSPRQGFLLHSDDFVLENSTKVKDGIAMTSDARIVGEISTGKGPRQFLLMIGYAGWAPGQLEDEIKAKSWFLIRADKELIFGKEAEKKWRRAMDKRQIRL